MSMKYRQREKIKEKLTCNLLVRLGPRSLFMEFLWFLLLCGRAVSAAFVSDD